MKSASTANKTINRKKEGLIMIEELLKGNKEWQKTFNEKGLKELEQGQSPKYLVFACSDSRVVPDYIFNTLPGTIFTARNIANCLGDKEKAVNSKAIVEYAVNHLKIKNIIVLGHTKCGGMHALACNNLTDEDSSIKKWIKSSEEAKEKLNELLKRRNLPLEGEDYEQALIETNALLQINHLKSMNAIHKNNANLHAWTYDLENGRVKTCLEKLEEYEILNELLEYFRLEKKAEGQYS